MVKVVVEDVNDNFPEFLTRYGNLLFHLGSVSYFLHQPIGSQVSVFATKILSKRLSGIKSVHFKKRKYEITQAALNFSLFKFIERRTCKDLSGKDRTLDSDWLAQKMSTKMKFRLRYRPPSPCQKFLPK